jgi:hypothetical protein
MLLYWGYRARREDEYSVVMLAWVLAGLSIPLALPRGFLGHWYYTWGLVVPIAITTAEIAKQLVDDDFPITLAQFSTLAVTVSLILPLILTPVVPFTINNETSITPAPGVQLIEPSDQALNRAEELEQYNNLESADGIVFVGEFNQSRKWIAGSFPAYVLIYSDILVTERRFDKRGKVSITDSPPEECSVIVYSDRVRRCNGTGQSPIKSDMRVHSRRLII